MKNFTLPSIKLLYGHKAPYHFYTAVQQAVIKGIPSMLPNRCYTAKQLCGEKFWNDLSSNWWRWLAGRCVAHMVCYKRLKVKFYQYKKSRTNHYIIN